MLFLFMGSCGPATSRYPSYENAIAKYAPAGEYEAVRVTDPNDCPRTSYCDYCPRVWYHDHWIYWHHHHWIYWHYGHWYYYPYIYIYYHGGVPHVYRRPTLNVSMGMPNASHPGAVGNRGSVPSNQSMSPARPHLGQPTAQPRKATRKSPSSQMGHLTVTVER